MACNIIPKEKREYLNIKCQPEELQSIKLIINKINCASQALSPRMIPEDCPEPQVKSFMKHAIDYKAEALFLETDWWEGVKKKYNLPAIVFIDLETGEFYKQKGA